LRAGLADRRGGCLDLEILRERAVDEGVEIGIAKRAPPAREFGSAGARLQLRLDETAGDRRLRRMVVRSDGAAGEQQGADGSNAFHANNPARTVSECCFAKAVRSSGVPPAGTKVARHKAPSTIGPIRLK